MPTTPGPAPDPAATPSEPGTPTTTPVATPAFGARLAAAMADVGPLCVGIDPHPALLEQWGLPHDAGGLRSFALTCAEAFVGVAAAVKPQAAFFEEHGAEGVAVLEEVLAAIAASGTLSILDVKRGDVGSTMAGYARAYLSDASPLRADAVTLSPYLGFGSLAPALETAAATGRGAFVLALTSNPEGAAVQHAVRDGRSVARHVVDGVAAENAPARARGELGSVGLVVGATVGSAVADLGLDLAGAGGPLLAPGIGAQGATGEDARAVFGAAAGRVLASSSREVLSAGPSATDLRRRCADVAAGLGRALGTGAGG